MINKGNFLNDPTHGRLATPSWFKIQTHTKLTVQLIPWLWCNTIQPQNLSLHVSWISNLQRAKLLLVHHSPLTLLLLANKKRQLASTSSSAMYLSLESSNCRRWRRWWLAALRNAIIIDAPLDSLPEVSSCTSFASAVSSSSYRSCCSNDIGTRTTVVSFFGNCCKTYNSVICVLQKLLTLAQQ